MVLDRTKLGPAPRGAGRIHEDKKGIGGLSPMPESCPPLG